MVFLMILSFSGRRAYLAFCLQQASIGRARPRSTHLLSVVFLLLRRAFVCRLRPFMLHLVAFEDSSRKLHAIARHMDSNSYG